MTNREFSDQFDVLYNSITSNMAPGIDEYEKSVFLTKALDEIVKAYFSARSNKLLEGFDDSERRLIDFSMLMRTVNGLAVTPSINIHTGSNTGYYAMPDDILLYINEILEVSRKGHTTHLSVVSLNYAEYNRLMSKPYKRPLKNLAWRLINSGAASEYTYTDYASIAAKIAADDHVDGDVKASDVYALIGGHTLEYSSATKALKVDDKYIQSDGTLGTSGFALNTTTYGNDINKVVQQSKTVVELIPGSGDTITGYIVRYVARPRPIILTDLTDEGVSLGGGKQTELSCQLDPILHQEILQRAVELAKIAYSGSVSENLTNALALGAGSGTPIGITNPSANNNQ